MSEQLYMQFDYETFSKCDITLCGAVEYSLHRSTEILCVAFRIGTKAQIKKKATMVWSPKVQSTSGYFPIFLAALRDPKIILVARNAMFEMLITKNVFGRTIMPSKPELQNIPIDRWICTASLSRAVGIPGSLEGSGAALGLPHQKDKAGHKHMLKVCQPRKPTKDNPSTRHDTKEDMKKLIDYCVKDVEADVDCFLALPPLHESDRKFWLQNIRTNLRGFAVDRKLVKGALHLIGKESIRLDSRVRKLTAGKLNSCRQRAKLLAFVNEHNCAMRNMKAQTVQERLKKPFHNPVVKELLQIREAISRSSTAKYAMFEYRSRNDGRARDNTIFYGAHTGREAGTGLQPQNLFKTILKQEDVEAGLELIRNRDVHTIEALYDKPMDLYASAIRSCIIAGKNKLLQVGDFATIEVRVLFWLSGNQKGLDMLAKGEPLYSLMAGAIYTKDGLEIEKGYQAKDKDSLYQRTVGKHTVLGAGFGMGLNGEKFKITCASFGVPVTVELGQQAIKGYRKMFPRVPIFWSNTEDAATRAMKNPGKGYRVGYIIWRKEGNWLTAKLPIGRKLYYYKPELRRVKTLWGSKISLTYLAVKHKQLYRITTWGGELAQHCTQAVARDLLKESLLTLEQEKITEPVLEVHDEIVGENFDQGDEQHNGAVLTAFEKGMARVPSWAKGLPIKVEGWQEFRYRK